MKKMGRPTTNPKTTRFEIRASEEEIKKLEECAKALGKNRSEIVIMGIEKIYKESVLDLQKPKT